MKDLLKKLSQALASIGLIFILTILGSVSGQGPKWLRRFIIPLLVTIYAYFLLQNWWVLSCYLMAFPLSLGYGTVSPDDDKPSWFGKIAYKLFPKSQVLQNVIARGTVAFLIVLSMLSVPILTKNWLSYLLGSVGIILIWSLVSWRGFGSIPVKLFRKEYNLLNVDLVVYGVTALGLVLIINGWAG